MRTRTILFVLSHTLMKYHSYTAEFFGTFLLALIVRLAVSSSLPVATPVIAGMTLGLLVYAVGTVSGAHVNPAVTIGLAIVRKIKPKDAVIYVALQCLGGVIAGFVGTALLGGSVVNFDAGTSIMPAFFEAIGAFILVLGVSSVVFQKALAPVSGLTIGTALALGALTASVGSAGIVNPAVALALNAYSPLYLLGPIVGGIISALGYKARTKA